MKGQRLKNLEGVIFDLGGTLLHLQKDPIQMHEIGAKLIYKYLSNLGCDLPCESKLLWDLYKIRKYLSDRTATELKQYTAADAMIQLLKIYNQESVINDQVIKKMVSLYFEPEMDAYTTPSSVHSILRDLKTSGIKLGLLSNATDHTLIVVLLKKHGLYDFFDPIVTSVSAGYPKPHHLAYESVTKTWSVNSAKSIAMVGDNVHLDLIGAKKLGMITVWLKPQHMEPFETPYADLTLSSFQQLQKLLKIRFEID